MRRERTRLSSNSGHFADNLQRSTYYESLERHVSSTSLEGHAFFGSQSLFFSPP